MDFLEREGAILRGGHFPLSSGKHTDTFIAKEKILSSPRLLKTVSHAMAMEAVIPWLKDKSGHMAIPDVVVGPESGGAKLASHVAEHLSWTCNDQILAAYIDRMGKKLQMRRGYDVIVGEKKVLLVDDVCTTGGSLGSAIEAIRQAGGEIIRVVLMANRTNLELSCITNVPASALITTNLPVFDPGESCSGCRKGIPLDVNYGRVDK